MTRFIYFRMDMRKDKRKISDPNITFDQPLLSLCGVSNHSLLFSLFFHFNSKKKKKNVARRDLTKQHLSVYYRSVPPAQRSYALGMQMDLVRVLGAIPGPIVFGALLDKTCILWNSK